MTIFLVFTKFYILRRRAQNKFLLSYPKVPKYRFSWFMLEIFCLKLCGLRQAFGVSFAWVHEGRQARLGYHIARSYDPLATTRSLHAPSAVRMSIFACLLPLLSKRRCVFSCQIFPDRFSLSPILITFDAFCYTTHRRVPSCTPHFSAPQTRRTRFTDLVIEVTAR